MLEGLHNAKDSQRFVISNSQFMLGLSGAGIPFVRPQHMTYLDDRQINVMLHVLSFMPTPQSTNPSLAEVRVVTVCYNSIFFMLMHHVSYSTDREIFVVSN